MAIINFHLRSGRDNDFPKKQFIVEGVEKMFCSYLFFTHSETTIQNKSEKIEYRCLLCKTTLLAWHQIAETSSDISKMTVSTVICSLRGLKVKYLYLKLIVNLSIYP